MRMGWGVAELLVLMEGLRVGYEDGGLGELCELYRGLRLDL